MTPDRDSAGGSAALRRAGRAAAFCGCLLAGLLCCSGSPGQKAPRSEAVPVVTALVEQKDVPVDLRAIGTVEAYHAVEVRARVGGEITDVYFREGQEVQAGDLLFTLDSRPYEAALKAARADLAREEARAQTAEADARRYAELAAKDYVTQQQSEQAAATARAERATVEALEADVETARLNLEYCRLRAPIAGRTGDVRIRQGNLVSASDPQPLVTIHQVRPVRVSFSAPERMLEEIRGAAAGEPPVVLAAPSGSTQEPHRGSLVFLDNAVDASTGTVLLKAVFPNEDEALWPGQFVNVRLRLRTLPGAVVVPESAVQAGQKGPFVYVVEGGETAQVRPVAVGHRLDGEIVITDGVRSGETVVTDGQLRLTPGAKVSVSSGLAPVGSPAGASAK